MNTRITCGIITVLLWSELSVGANGIAGSTIVLPTPFSPGQVPVRIVADESLDDATFALFVRASDEEKIGAWEPATGLEIVSATQGIYDGTHGERYDFRSAIFSPRGSEMAVLADFDYKKSPDGDYYTREMNRIFPACSLGGFNQTFYFRANDSKQGLGCYHFTFSSDQKDRTDIPPDALIGLHFDASIPVRDWSPYRYLEMFYKSNVPGGMDLWIETDAIGFRRPIVDFSQDGDSLNVWHSILVDLDRMMGGPQARKEIRTFAFTRNVSTIDITQTYDVLLDSIRLWQTRNFVSTAIDDTPPTQPANLNYALQGDSIVWTWDSSDDRESDVAGYSVQFTQDRRIPFPYEINAATHSIAIPFVKPPFYQEYTVLVSACNKAGLWSPLEEKRVSFAP